MSVRLRLMAVKSIWWAGGAWALVVIVSCADEPRVPPPRFDAGGDAALDASVDDSGDDDAGAAADRLPRNVIVFMGDGMGPEQLAAGRFMAGGRLRLDALAGPAFANTDSLTTIRIGGNDPPATDSAAAATVLATGVLVENGVLSVSPAGEPLETVVDVYKRVGKAIGLVTTSTFFDASPAGFATHQPSRGLAREIAHEMMQATQAEVIMGSGSWLFDDPAGDLPLVAEQEGYTLVRGLSALAAWDPSTQPKLLGLFETNFVPVVNVPERLTMTPALERTADSPDPTLATMTQRALDRLAQDPDGFFLFAEDELFDEMGHRGPAEVEWANRALPPQVLAFDAAVMVAIDWVLAHSSFDDTLIVVLADHETGGYHFDHEVGPSSGDFAASGDNGSFRFGFHTRTPIAVYALGPGSDSILHVMSHADTHRLLLGTLP